MARRKTNETQSRPAARKTSSSSARASTTRAAGAGTQRKASTGQRAPARRANVSHEAIAHEAFLIWEAAGRPHGQELSHWLEAERRVGAAA